ncbi:MAG: hypothetical protein V4760_03785 [Bdellovibrionota bacterium]
MAFRPFIKLASTALSLALTAGSANAQSNPGAGQLDFTPGKPLTMSWDDGRVATLRVTSLTIPKQLGISFQVFDNDCTSAKGMKCIYRSSFRNHWAQFVWTKHSDPSKIGSIVQKKSSNGVEPLEESIMSTGLESKFLPELTQGLLPTEIECADFSWLPTGTLNAPANLMIDRWEAETMFMNEETGNTENRTFGGAVNLELSSKAPNVLKIDRVGAFTASGPFFTQILILGDVNALTLTKPTGETCDVSLKPGGLGEVQNNIGNAETKRPDAKLAADYINGSGLIGDVIASKHKVPFLRDLNEFRDREYTKENVE